jgi:ABC-type thiamin/hydroxymethylpyrimidine transport system permease subunit
MNVAKAVAQAVGTIVVAIIPLLVIGPLGFSEIVNVIIVGLGAFLVWNTKNYPNWRYGKALASGAATLGAGLVALASNYAFGDVSTQQWVQLLVSIVTTVAVYFIPNAGYVYRDAAGREAGPHAV